MLSVPATSQESSATALRHEQKTNGGTADIGILRQIFPATIDQFGNTVVESITLPEVVTFTAGQTNADIVTGSEGQLLCVSKSDTPPQLWNEDPERR